MGLRHLKLDVASFTVDWADQTVDQEEHQNQSKSSVNERPNHVIPTLRHHGLLHGRGEGFRWFHHRFNQAIVVLDRLNEFDHVDAPIFVSIEVLNDGDDVEFSEVNARETRDGFGQFLMGDGL